MEKNNCMMEKNNRMEQHLVMMAMKQGIHLDQEEAERQEEQEAQPLQNIASHIFEIKSL